MKRRIIEFFKSHKDFLAQKKFSSDKCTVFEADFEVRDEMGRKRMEWKCLDGKECMKFHVKEDGMMHYETKDKAMKIETDMMKFRFLYDMRMKFDFRRARVPKDFQTWVLV